MELRTTREMRRNVQLDKAMGKKSETPEAPAKGQPLQEPTDKLTLSQQALSWVDEQNRQMWDAAQERESRHQDRFGGLLDAMETQKNQLDAMNDKLDVMSKCQKIAASIMKGNRVPPEDLAYLMEHDKEGYKLAMAMRRENPDPKEEKSVLDEEDKNGGSTGEAGEAGGSGEAPSVSAPEASSGGGGASASAQ